MAYRPPRFNMLHAAREAPVGNLTSKNPSAAGFPVERLIDGRQAAPWKAAAVAADHFVEVNRGTGTLEAIDRMVIPPGHNLSGVLLTVTVQPAGTVLGSVTPADAGLIDLPLTSSSAQNIRLAFGASVQPEMGEWYLTRIRGLDAEGIDPEWTDEPRYQWNGRDAPTIRTGTFLAPARRFIVMNTAGMVSPDLDVWTELGVRAQDLQPFYLDMPNDQDPPLFVQVVSDPRAGQDAQAPAVMGESYEIEFFMLEVTE